MLDVVLIAYAEEEKQDLKRSSLMELLVEANKRVMWEYQTTKVYDMKLMPFDYYLNSLLEEEIKRKLI